jgi:hypothetical protein
MQYVSIQCSIDRAVVFLPASPFFAAFVAGNRIFRADQAICAAFYLSGRQEA